MALWAWLVEKRVYENIYIYRLPVGHTHNELDQCFQAPSVWFHGPTGVKCLIPEEFLAECKKCYSQNKERYEADVRANPERAGRQSGHERLNPFIEDLEVTYDVDGKHKPTAFIFTQPIVFVCLETICLVPHFLCT